MKTTWKLIAAAACAMALAAPASAQQKIKIGFITTLSGPQGVIGKHMKDSVELALDHLGHKMAGIPVEVVYGDDQFKPDVGVQVVEEMLKKDQVDFVAGEIWSNIMLAIVPVVTKSGHIMVGTNAGASPLAGEQCDRLFFTTSWNNDQAPEAMGKFLQDSKIDDLYLMAPNYQAGKDMMGAFRETFLPAGGKVVAEDYPKLGETDYAPYLTKIKQSGAKAVFAFFSGSYAVNFVKQYDQFGLKQSIKLTGAGFLTEPDVLPAQGTSALGVITGHFYTPLLDNPTNQRFVKEFHDKFGGKMPDGFACQGYDTAEVIVRSLKAVNGNTQDKDKLVEVITKTEFESPRGHFRFDPKTHNVIQPFIYIREVKEVAGGINNVPIDKVADVKDPGTGCTLPA